MLGSIINLLSSVAIEGHTPQTAVAAVLCAALVGLFSQWVRRVVLRLPDLRIKIFVGTVSEVPSGKALSYPRELLHPHFLAQTHIEAHINITDQQTALRRDLNPLLADTHQPILRRRCQQFQVFGKIVSEVQTSLLFHRDMVEAEVADQELNNITTNAAIAGQGNSALQHIPLLVYLLIIASQLFLALRVIVTSHTDG